MKGNMLKLSGTPEQRLARYQAMKHRGNTLREIIRNTASNSYSCNAPSKGWNGTESNRIAAWYCFPKITGKARDLRAASFSDVFGTLRCVGYAADCEDIYTSARDTTGYYTDNYQNGIVYPLVFKLPGSRGYLRGYYWDDKGECVLLDGIYGDARSAFYAAHSYADQWAQDAREYDAQLQKDYWSAVADAW